MLCSVMWENIYVNVICFWVVESIFSNVILMNGVFFWEKKINFKFKNWINVVVFVFK